MSSKLHKIVIIHISSPDTSHSASLHVWRVRRRGGRFFSVASRDQLAERKHYGHGKKHSGQHFADAKKNCRDRNCTLSDGGVGGWGRKKKKTYVCVCDVSCIYNNCVSCTTLGYMNAPRIHFKFCYILSLLQPWDGHGGMAACGASRRGVTHSHF